MKMMLTVVCDIEFVGSLCMQTVSDLYPDKENEQSLK